MEAVLGGYAVILEFSMCRGIRRPQAVFVHDLRRIKPTLFRLKITTFRNNVSHQNINEVSL